MRQDGGTLATATEHLAAPDDARALLWRRPAVGRHRTTSIAATDAGLSFQVAPGHSFARAAQPERTPALADVLRAQAVVQPGAGVTRRTRHRIRRRPARDGASTDAGGHLVSDLGLVPLDPEARSTGPKFTGSAPLAGGCDRTFYAGRWRARGYSTQATTTSKRSSTEHRPGWCSPARETRAGHPLRLHVACAPTHGRPTSRQSGLSS